MVYLSIIGNSNDYFCHPLETENHPLTIFPADDLNHSQPRLTLRLLHFRIKVQVFDTVIHNGLEIR